MAVPELTGEQKHEIALKKAGPEATAAGKMAVTELTGEQKREAQNADIEVRKTMQDSLQTRIDERLARAGKDKTDPNYDKYERDEMQREFDKMHEEAKIKAEQDQTAEGQNNARRQEDQVNKLEVEYYKAKLDAGFTGLGKGEKPTLPAPDRQKTPKVPDEKYDAAVNITKQPEFKNLTPAEQARIESVIKAWRRQNAI